MVKGRNTRVVGARISDELYEQMPKVMKLEKCTCISDWVGELISDRVKGTIGVNESRARWNVGPNQPCPCGSKHSDGKWKKYKHCCGDQGAQMRRGSLPPGRFRYESGSYGDSGAYVPSIMGYKETGTGTWLEHLCLVKPDAIFDEEAFASEMAERHLAAAQTIMDSGGGPQEFALSLRHEGYKSVNDFRVVRSQK